MNPRICDMSSFILGTGTDLGGATTVSAPKKKKKKWKKTVTHHVLPRPEMETEGNDIICWHYVKIRYDPGG